MPGNVLVSVLEFVGLRSSSSSSSLSLRVSMGKIQYQTMDRGDFSFPLTTLRDNLIVALLDADGKEISHAGVEIKSIVEKGLWDDLFPLEGGGHVHMKLQFVLSEEDRNRIRIMRASALKIKHDELLNRSIGSSRSATKAGGTVASSMGFSHEVSVIIEEGASKSCLVSNPDTKTIKGLHPDQKQFTSNDAGQYEEVSLAILVPQGVEDHLTEENHGELLEKSERLHIAAKSISVPQNLEEDRVHNPQRHSHPGKTPSKVRTMISAFESGLAQDPRTSIEPPLPQSESKELQHGPTHVRKRGEQINTLGAVAGSKSSVDTGKLKDLNTQKFQIKGRNLNLRDKFKEVHKDLDTEEEKYHQDLVRLSTSNKPTMSGRMLDEYSGRHTPQLRNLQEIDLRGTLYHKFESLECSEAKNSSSESSGAWVFPDEARRLCVTTAGKKVMNLMGSSSTKPKVHEGRLNLPMQENIEPSVDAGNAIKGDRHESHHKIRKQKPENPKDINTPGGPLGQAMKIAIMVGFGILVFFTRQKNNR